MTTYPFRTRRWTRAEYHKLDELGVLPEDEPVELIDSEPEPDVAVASGGPRDYLADHPARPVLVVEVAESSLEFDRVYKGSAYARAELSDCWIVNIVDWQVEVYQRPGADATA